MVLGIMTNTLDARTRCGSARAAFGRVGPHAIAGACGREPSGEMFGVTRLSDLDLLDWSGPRRAATPVGSTVSSGDAAPRECA